MKRLILNSLLFLPLLLFSQNRWMIPANMLANHVKRCTITKAIPYKNKPGDSIVRKEIFIEYDSLKKQMRLTTYRADSAMDYQEITNYDALGNAISTSERDYPDTRWYPATEPKDGFAKHMYEELHGHNRHSKKTFSYNERKQVTEKKYYDADFTKNELSEADCYLIEKFRYDDKGRLLEEKEFERINAPKFEESGSAVYEYDARGNKVKEIITGDEGKPSINIYNYDSLDHLIEIIYDFVKGRPSYSEKYSYDSLGGKCRRIKLDESGKIFERRDYKYKDTLLLEESYKSDRGDYNSMRSVKYDPQGYVIWEKDWQLNGGPYVTSPTHYKIILRKYSKDSSIVEEKRYYRKKTKDDYAGKWEYTYNNVRQVIKEKNYTDEDSLWSIYLYEYNAKGQRSKVTIFNKDSILQNVEINFYDSLGQRSARELYRPDRTLQLYQTYKYNDKHEEIGGIFFQGGAKITIKEFRYFPDKLLQLVHVNEQGKEYFFRYAYE